MGKVLVTDHTNCEDCAEDEIDVNATVNSECLVCLSGKVPVTDSPKCEDCKNNTIVTNGTCVMCPEGMAPNGNYTICISKFCFLGFAH